jgi:hypothetical protein
MMPSDTPLSHRAFAWSSVMGGPILGTAWGMATDYPIIRLGWLGLFLIPAHPVRPQPVMGCVTVIGLVLWFIAGALAMMVAAHGG